MYEGSKVMALLSYHLEKVDRLHHHLYPLNVSLFDYLSQWARLLYCW
jgi:hypothetical protein